MREFALFRESNTRMRGNFQVFRRDIDRALELFWGHISTISDGRRVHGVSVAVGTSPPPGISVGTQTEFPSVSAGKRGGKSVRATPPLTKRPQFGVIWGSKALGPSPDKKGGSSGRGSAGGSKPSKATFPTAPIFAPEREVLGGVMGEAVRGLHPDLPQLLEFPGGC